VFSKSTTWAVRLASIGLVVITSIQYASGDELANVQQNQQSVAGQSSNVGGASIDHGASQGNCNHLGCRLLRPWIMHEHDADCNCLTCRCRRSCFSRNVNTCHEDKQLFHWYIRGNGPAIHTRPAGIYWW